MTSGPTLSIYFNHYEPTRPTSHCIKTETSEIQASAYVYTLKALAAQGTSARVVLRRSQGDGSRSFASFRLISIIFSRA